MNQSQANKVLESQTAMARKVMKAVPIQEYWSLHQIKLELERLGTPAQTHVIGGCLRSLKEVGLVKQDSYDQYRSCVKPIRILKEEIVEPKKEVARPLSFPERLLAKAEALRAEANELEALAMQAEEELKAAAEAAETKLKNIQSTLRELMGA